ncbi:unnamed protein product, partial [Aureobasidium uvarum]
TAMSASHHYEQLQRDHDSEHAVDRHKETDTTEDPRLYPREFKSPSASHTLWLGGVFSRRFGTIRQESIDVDLRYILPIAVLVGLFSAIPYLVHTATWEKMAKIARKTELNDTAIDLIVFRKISFTAAKAIDLAWNVLVGRDFQATAAFMCYRLFTGILYLLAEQQSVSAETFSALVFNPTSLLSLGPVFRTMVVGKLALFNRLAAIWIAISIMYLLLIVTMADLMTGYITGEVTWLPNGTMMEMDPVDWDGLGTISNSLYTDPPPENATLPGKTTVRLNWTQPANVSQAIVPSSPGSLNGTMFFQQCLNVSDMGLFYVDAIDRWGPPYDSWVPGYTDFTVSPEVRLLTSYPAKSCMNLFVVGEWTYNMYMVGKWWQDATNFRCLPSTDYAWYTILLTSINSLWLVITVSLWLYVELKSQSLQKRGAMGTWRAVLDLASAFQQRLGHDTGGYTEAELEQTIGKLQPLAYDVYAADLMGTERIVLRECKGTNEWRKKRFTLRWRTKYC